MLLMKLLLAEDDKDLCAFAREGLIREGFAVDVARNGQEAVDLASERQYDVILLDVMMPELDGFAVLKTLRSRGYQGAVLLATCKGQERDKLKGLNSGADDYIVKPYLLSELTARIRSILRRTSLGPGKIIQDAVLKAGVLELDLLKREVKKSGKPVSLTKREFELLEYLMRRPGQVISQAVLAQHLTSVDYEAQTNTIEVHIKNLRAKIDAKFGDPAHGRRGSPSKEPEGGSLIRTVRGFGYSLNA